MHFVFRAGLEIQDAAGKARRHLVIVIVDASILRLGSCDELAAHAEKWQRLAPGLLSRLAIGHGHAGVAVVIAADRPVEAQREQGWPFDMEGAWSDGIG